MSQPYPPRHSRRVGGVDDPTAEIPRYRPDPPAAPPAARKRRSWPWVVGGPVVVVVIGSAVGANSDPNPTSIFPPSIPTVDVAAPGPVPQPTRAPAPAPTVAAPASARALAPPVPAEPDATVSQRSAAESAESYLDYSGFSRTGLIKQLKFEGFSTADATFAVETVTVNWMAEAEQSATGYMDFSSFSRSGLIHQLEFEGFTSGEAAHGADFVGL